MDWKVGEGGLVNRLKSVVQTSGENGKMGNNLSKLIDKQNRSFENVWLSS